MDWTPEDFKDNEERKWKKLKEEPKVLSILIFYSLTDLKGDYETREVGEQLKEGNQGVW